MTNAFENLETGVRNVVKEQGPNPDATALANAVVAHVKNTVGELEGQVSALALEAEGLRSELQLANNKLLDKETSPEIPAPTEDQNLTPAPTEDQNLTPAPTEDPSTGTELSDTLAGGQ